ncbi:unnamed protein product [Sphagnum troendelagicum]|uniref:Uncharacterized protein n=1 Tax=Sphagnum troendelagicum TaxID=128251 RepID=A0ABP0UGT7_9BRYO
MADVAVKLDDIILGVRVASIVQVAGDVISTVQDVPLQPGASSGDEEALAFQDNDEFFDHSDPEPWSFGTCSTIKLLMPS